MRRGRLHFFPCGGDDAPIRNRPEIDTIDEELGPRAGVAVRRRRIVDCTLRRADLAAFLAGR